MPQLTLEFSSNILEKDTLTSLFKTCHTIMASSLPTEIVSCKSRGIETSSYYIGDGNPTNAFVHTSLKIKSGRSKETLENLGQALIKAFQVHFANSINKLNLQITLEIIELQDTYFAL